MMERKSEKVKDKGLIKEGLKKRITDHSEKTGEEISEVASNAFRKGLAYYAVSTEEIPRIDSDRLVDDSFSYRRWQLNIYTDFSEQYPGIQWSEVKSAFLEKGLDQMQ